MQIQTTVHDGKATLKLAGRFQFDVHREFRTAYEAVIGNAAAKAIVLDLAAVDYLDSSALGMLLLIKEKAGSVQKGVSIVGASGAVRQVLDIANFDKLFSIA